MKKTIVLLCALLIAFAVLFTACNKAGDKDKMTMDNQTTTQPAGNITTANETTSKGAVESKAEEIGTTIKDNLESIAKASPQTHKKASRIKREVINSIR